MYMGYNDQNIFNFKQLCISAKVIVLHVKGSMEPELSYQNIIEDDVEISGKLTASINALPNIFPNKWL